LATRQTTPAPLQRIDLTGNAAITEAETPTALGHRGPFRLLRGAGVVLYN
jgi:hypothetical protein